MTDQLREFEQILGYEFADKSLLAQALTHKSCKNERNNERLEFLGDAVLDLVVGEYLFAKFSHKNEGSLSKMRASLVNEGSFFKIAGGLRLREFVRMSASEERNGGRQKHSIISDALEAVMGAAYLEGGVGLVRGLFIPLLEAAFGRAGLQNLSRDYKTALQEITQERMAQTPEYRLVSASGPDHKKCFEMAVFLGGREWARASGGSKKEAEQLAAQKVIEILGR